MERLVRSYYSDYESITPSDPLDPPVSLLTATADRSDCTLHKYFPARGGGYTIYATDPNPGFEPLPPLGTTPIMNTTPNPTPIMNTTPTPNPTPPTNTTPTPNPTPPTNTTPTPNPTPPTNTTPTPNPGTGGVGEPTEQIPVVSDTTALLYEYPSATIPNPTACVVYGRPAEQLWGLHGYVWGTSMTATLNNPNYKLCLLTGSLGVNGSCPSWSEQSSSNAEGFPELTSPYGLEYRSVCVVPLVQGTEEAWQLRVTVTPES